MIYVDSYRRALNREPAAGAALYDGRAMIVLNGDDFLTVEEAATMLGIKPATL